MDIRGRRFINILFVLMFLWVGVTMMIVNLLPSTGSDLNLTLEKVQFSGENSYTYPRAPPGTYCERWSHTGEYTLWADRRSAYSV